MRIGETDQFRLAEPVRHPGDFPQAGARTRPGYDVGNDGAGNDIASRWTRSRSALRPLMPSLA
jgi:hypothetical protein